MTFSRLKKIILLLFLLSGLSALVYEVVWFKMFSYLFGVTIYSLTVVIAIFMLGLSFGSFLFGKRIDKSKDPVKIYVLLELGIILYALFFPLLYKLLNNIIIFYYNHSSNSEFDLLIKIFLACIFLIIPTTLMGGTLPVMSRFLIKNKNEISETVGELYAFNTYGGVLGVILSAFILIPILGLNNSLYFAAMINLIVLFSVLLLRKKINYKYPEILNLKNLKDIYSKKFMIILLIMFFFSGFISFSYEVLWFRILREAFGLHIHAFAIMLGSLLFGLASGSIIYARVLYDKKNQLKLFALAQLCIALSVIITLVIYQYYFILSPLLKSLSSYAVVLLPSFFIGLTFPIVTQLYVSKIKFVGKRLGFVYSINIIGTILGSIITGFWLLSYLGIRNSLAIMISGNFILALIAFFMIINFSKKNTRFNFNFKNIYNYLIFVFLLIIIFANIFILHQGGSFKMKTFSSGNEIYFSEGLNSNIQVITFDDSSMIYLDTKVMASTIYEDVKLLKLISHLPLIFNSNTQSKDVLVIGLGTGMTAGSASLYNLSNLTVVELSRNMKPAANLFSNYNYNLTKNENVTFIFDDARNYLLRNDNLYDVIASDPIDPWISGAGNLYSLEFYQEVKNSLKDNGIFSQWLPLYGVSKENLEIIISTFLSVFPETSIWYSKSDVIILGSKNELIINYQNLETTFKNKKILHDFNTIMINNSAELLSHYITNQDTLIDFVKTAKINSNNFPILEYSEKVPHISSTINPNKLLILDIKNNNISFLENISSQERIILDQYFNSKLHVLKAETSLNISIQKEELELALEINPQDLDAQFDYDILIEHNNST